MLALFKTNPTEATLIAVVAFALGAIVSAVVSRCLCGCAKSGQKKPKKPAKAPASAVKFQKQHAGPEDGSIEIYVGNLSYDLTEDRLRSEFEAYGKVNSARIITNRYNGKSKGFGFVHMPDEKEVEAAIAALNDKDILGRKLKCNVAKH